MSIYSRTKNRILTFDENWFLRIFSWSGKPRLDRSMRVITRLGDGYFWPILGVSILFYDFHTGILVFRVGLLAFAIELPLFQVIKKKTSRKRPYVALPEVKRLTRPQEPYSFPSGHTAGAVIMAYVVGEMFPLLFYPLLGLASLIGFSRIYVGVHYPLDVLIGGVGGAISAITALKLLQ